MEAWTKRQAESDRESRAKRLRELHDELTAEVEQRRGQIAHLRALADDYLTDEVSPLRGPRADGTESVQP
jgi:hypothetical protein